MFGYFKRNRAKVVVQSVMPGLREGIQSLAPVDRAATLAIVNAMMEAAADQWGQGVLTAPTKIPRDTAAQAVVSLAAHHAKLVRDGLGRMQDRGMGDVAYAQAMRETRATEMLIATIGSCLHEGSKEEVAAAWGLLWKARGSTAEAAETLRDYARHAKVDPVPRSRRRLHAAGRADLERLASSVPPFLRPRKPAATALMPAAGGKGRPARPARGGGGR